MSEYGSRLLLRRICMSRDVRIWVQVDRTADRELWTLHAFDDVRQRTWVVEDESLDHAARELACQVGLVLPSDQLLRPLFGLRSRLFAE